MFDVLLERSSGEGSSGAGPSGTGFLALSVLFGYTVVATIVAGGFAVPAGLFVFALGCLATVVVDHAYWRESAFPPAPRRAEPPPPERLAPAASQAALPAPPAREQLDAPTPESARESASASASESAAAPLPKA